MIKTRAAWAAGQWFARLAKGTAVGGLLVLCACGGGGGSGTASGGGGGTSVYTVGGAITGLTTSGLTLAWGSQTVSPAANATTFTFPTAEATGTAYSVSVSAQPAGATCTVANGSGTIAGANVTNIAVTCTANTYSIGGTIQGYTQAQGSVGTPTLLKLANGSDSVTPAFGDTSFTFNTKVPSGTAYNVTVAQNPTGLNCTVGQAQGTVASANVTNVSVTCTSSYTYQSAPSDCTHLADGAPYNPNASYNQQGVGFALYRIKTDGTAVYWYDYDPAGGATGGAIKSVPVTGGTVTTIASGLEGVNDLYLDATTIYWTEFSMANSLAGSIKSAPKSGGAAPTVLATGTPTPGFDVFFPGGLAVDSTYVYWTEGVGGGAIRRVPKAGGAVTDINRGNFPAGLPAWVALDSTSSPTKFFFTNGGNRLLSPPETAKYFSMPLGGEAAGSTPTQLATTSALNAIDFVIDANNLYAADTSAPGSVFSIPLNGGSEAVLQGSLGDPQMVAIDANNIYYQDNSGAISPYGLAKRAKSGGAATYFPQCTYSDGSATNDFYAPVYVAADQSNVYFAGYGRNVASPVISIFKMPSSATYPAN
jgi:hypothetical protein